MEVLDGLAKSNLNYTRLHYVNNSTEGKHKKFTQEVTPVPQQSHKLPQNSEENTQLFDIVQKSYKSSLSGLLPNPMVKPPLSRGTKISRPYSTESRTIKKKTLSKKSESIFEIMKTWEMMAKLDKELHHYLQDLALRPDFAVLDLFRCFDIYGKGYITLHEFLMGLEKFDLHPDKLDASLVLKYYDKNFDGKVSLKEFKSMVVPQQKEYAKILNSRPGQNTNSCLDYDELFSAATISYVQRCFEELFGNVVAIESLRQRLVNKLGILPHLVFADLDYNKDGKINDKDVFF